MTWIGRAARRLALVPVLAPALAPGAAHAAQIVTRPAALRLGKAVELSLSGTDPAAEYSAYAELRGRPCVRDQSAWQIGVVDPGRVSLYLGEGNSFTPSTRLTRLCAYTLVRPDDGSTPVRTFLTERLDTLRFTLPNGRTPLPLTGSFGDALAPLWTPKAAGFKGFMFSCQRKRFTLARRIPVGADWTFAASGTARPDNSTDYDVPIPPRYGGHASMSVQGSLSTVRDGVLRMTVTMTFRAPGLRRTGALPACRQGTRSFSTTFRL